MDEIITINGKKVKKSNCRLIDKEYYLIGDSNVENSGDVYLIDGRYIRMNTGKLVFNNTCKSYQLKNDSLEYGIISMGSDSDFVFGYFSKDINNLLLIDKDKKTHLCINEGIINRSFREELSSGNFYHISLKKACQFNLIRNVKKEYKESLPYDSKGMMQNHINRYDKNYNPVINSTIEKYSRILRDLTFGFEFETVKGVLPETKTGTLPLIPLRDGSIAGLEYVTIPLSGAKGIRALMDCVKELNKRTEYDNDCSLHLHIGNVPRTPEFILAFYKLITYYQEEIFSLFPLYKKYNFDVKRKNYSEPFPFNEINSKLDPSIDYSDKNQINKNFDVIFSHLAGQSFYDYKCDLNNVKSHPADPNGNQKWNIKKRYYAHNLIPLIFGNKETIEFRIHTPTYDIDKILNFLFINSYLINYAIINQDRLLRDPYFLDGKNGRNLDRLICNYHMNFVDLSGNDKDSLINYHLNYIASRKRATYEGNCKGDIIGKENDIFCHKSIDWEENQGSRWLKLKPRLNVENDYGYNDFDKIENKTIIAKELIRKIDRNNVNEFKKQIESLQLNAISSNDSPPPFPKRHGLENEEKYRERIRNWDENVQAKNFNNDGLYESSAEPFLTQQEDVSNDVHRKTIDDHSTKLQREIEARQLFGVSDKFGGIDSISINDIADFNFETMNIGEITTTKPQSASGTFTYSSDVFMDPHKYSVKNKSKEEEPVPIKVRSKSKFWS